MPSGEWCCNAQSFAFDILRGTHCTELRGIFISVARGIRCAIDCSNACGLLRSIRCSVLRRIARRVPRSMHPGSLCRFSLRIVLRIPCPTPPALLFRRMQLQRRRALRGRAD
jgi:hypothetical protein